MVTHDSAEYELLDRLADEFAQRYRQGERPSLKEYIDKYPHLADDIRNVFPAMVEIEQAEADRRDAGPEGEGDSAGEAPPLQQVGDYRILREIGRGGMGVVYEAEQISLGRRVALKVLPRKVYRDPKVLQRFWREAKAAARLHHTNIVPVFEVGQDGDTCYYAMQFIQGQGLDQVIEELGRFRSLSGGRRAADSPRGTDSPPSPGLSKVARSLVTGRFGLGPLPATPRSIQPAEEPQVAATEGYVATDRRSAAPTTPRPDAPTMRAEADSASSAVLPGETQLSSVESDHRHYFQSVARIGQQTAMALAYAHARAIIHRDIKPSNLLLDTSGVVWVTDFGLAKTDDDGLTNPGDVLGTLRYMAPERFRGECDARADVYALGLTLYELMVLKPAFAEHDRLRVIEQVKEQEPARPRSLDPRIPRDLEIIVLKATHKDPRRRYPSANDLAEDLRRFIAGEPIKARRTGDLERLGLWCRRQPALATLSAFLLLLLVLVAVGSTVTALYLRATLTESENNRKRAEDAELGGKHKLWESYLSQAQARRMSRQPGQRFASLRAIREALALPVPPTRSRDELRTEAIAALCLPDLEVAREWDGWPLGSEGFGIDSAFERYARGDRGGNVSVRRMSDDEELFRLPGVGPVVGYRGLEFSPDGRFLHQICRARQGYRGRLWKLEGPQPVALLDDDHVGFAFRPDSRRLAASYPDGSIRLFDTESGREDRRFRSPTTEAEDLCWNPRLPRIALYSRSACRILDADTGKLLLQVPAPGGVSWVDWHPEGRLLAVAGLDSRIYLWDTSSRRLVLPPLVGHKNGGLLLRFNHAGDRLLSTDWDHFWRLWDVRTGQQLLTQPAVGYFVGFSPDDQLLGASVSSPRARVFRFRRGEEFRTLSHDRNGKGGTSALRGIPVLGPRGRLLAAGRNDGVVLVDVERGEEVALLRVPDNAALGFEPTGALLTCGPAGVLRWPVTNDPDKGRRRYGPPQRLLSSERLHFHGVSADGQVVATPTGSGALVLHRSDGRILPLGPQADVRNCAVSPDGRWVATGSHGGRDGPGVKVWEARSGRHVKDLPAGVHGVLRFSPDGRWLLTMGGRARLWRVGAWQEGPDLGETSVNSLGAFSPDGKLLALSCSQGVVRLVAVDTGKEIARLTAPEQVRLMPCCFTSDGGQLITVGQDTQALHLFDLRAIRAQLAELDLDWDAPPLRAAAPAARESLQVEVKEDRADDCVSRASQHIRAKEYDKAQAALRQAIQIDPRHAAAHNSLAWLLLVGPAKMRNPREALSLASTAVQLVPGQAHFRNTLAVALYRNGRFAEAVPLLEQSLPARKGQSDAFDLFVLAMCHHRLGDAVRARDCYDRAVRWFQQNKSRLAAQWVEELTAFQVEADAVLALRPGSVPK